MLLEAVPNLSLGPGNPILDALIERLETETTPAWRLLDVHRDPDHNRSVLTLAGAPAPLVGALGSVVDHLSAEGSLAGHEGVHPRIGLIDVVPVVPLAGARWADAERAARQVAGRLARVGVPVYGYGRLATRPEHEALVGIRRTVEWGGGDDALPVDPDAGPGRFHERLGASCVGVRGLLIAYNVLLDTKDIEVGREIARALRPANGGLEGVQALAFALASEGGRVQVSTNVTDVDAATPADVYAFVEARARDQGVEVEGGELVGLAPERSFPSDPARMGLDQRPASLEDRLQEAGFTPSLDRP